MAVSLSAPQLMDPPTRCGYSSSAPPAASVVGLLESLGDAVVAADLAGLGSDDLAGLTQAARAGQQAIETLLMRVGVAADRLAAAGRTERDAHGVLLGDGRVVRGRTARREADRAKTAAELGRIGNAVEQGRLGGAHVDAIGQAAKGLTLEQRQRLNSDELIELAESTPVDVFVRHVRQEAERIKGDYGLADTLAKQTASTWKHWLDDRTGMGTIHAEFDPERYETIVNIVEQQVSRLANRGGVAKTANLAATAAFELLTGKAKPVRGLPHINVVIDHQTLAEGARDGSIRETGGGHQLAPESISRLACDAVLQRVVLDQRGVAINVGRKHRTATDAQWQATRAMYRTCAWDRCDRPLSWCQLHHIHEWEHGGPTDLCNLIPLCGKHHHAVHEGGWTVKLHADRRLDIHRPDGSYQSTTEPDRQPTAMVERRRQQKSQRPAAQPKQPAGP